MTNYIRLRKECERQEIGPLFWNLLVSVCGRVARRYPPDVFNQGESWSEEAIRDLAQDVALERLMEENQLDYVLSVATDRDSLARLLAFQVRRVLAHRRSITVVDRLLSRVLQVVGTAGYDLINFGSDSFVTLPGGSREFVSLGDREIRRGAQLIHPIPRLVSRPTAKRESKVYSRPDLEQLVGTLVRAFDGIALKDMRRVLEIVLTGWLPTFLRDSGEVQTTRSNPELEVQRPEMMSLINRFVHELEPAQRTVLLGKAQGIADASLATRLQRSRPWVAQQKCELLEVIEKNLISPLPGELHTEATGIFLDEVARIDEQNA